MFQKQLNSKIAVWRGKKGQQIQSDIVGMITLQKDCWCATVGSRHSFGFSNPLRALLVALFSEP